MSKNYKYYYTTHKLPSHETQHEYESDHNDEYESEDYYEGNCSPEYDNRQINYADCVTEDLPKTTVQPPAEPTKPIPKTTNKLPYCIVPVLYVPKRIVQKEEIARNKVLQNSLASLTRMENLFYKYKANYENDGSKQRAPSDIDVPLPQKGILQDFSTPNCYYDDTQYEYCTSSTNYEDDYVTKYRKQQCQEPFQGNYKTVSVVPKIQSPYERNVDPVVTIANRRSNAYVNASYFDRQFNDIHQYTRDDWLASQGRRIQSTNPINYNLSNGKLHSDFRNVPPNRPLRPASYHSIGINAIAEYDSKASQASGSVPGLQEKCNIYCETTTQTEPQNYVTTITHKLRSRSRHNEAKSNFCDGSNEGMQSHPIKSATMIPKLKTTPTSCNNATESIKSCIHERNSCDQPQGNIYQKPTRAVSPESTTRKIYK